MDFAAPHVSFVLWAFGLSGLTLAGFALWIIARDRKAKAALQNLEKE